MNRGFSLIFSVASCLFAILANRLPLQRKERVFVVSAFWRQSAWRLVVPVGFIFVTLGFALRLPAAFAATKEQQRKQPKTLYSATRLDSPTQFICQPWWATQGRTR
jgi:hypothetical protein